MIDLLILVLLWISSLGCGLIAGLYFAFSAFIMKALGRIEQAAGMSAMNSINTVILRSAFMPVFFGTTLTSALLAGTSVFRWGEAGTPAMLAGGILYVAGMFGVTIVFNVPLNNALAAAEPARSEGRDVWTRYLREWTFWNTVRTVASIAASACFIWAIAVR